MVFTSSIFLYGFLPAFLLLYALSPRRLKSLTLTLCSYVFYGWWRPDFVLLMLFSSMLDFTLGQWIERDRKSGCGTGKRWLVLSMIANLGLLGYFKYANFGVATFQAILRQFGWEGSLEWSAVVLPVGISFYTFQTMSYTIDVYRGQAHVVHRFVDFLCYVAMFPQLVAGPIVRYSVIEEELRTRRHTLAGFYQGLLFFQVGFAKKVLVADVVAPIADQAFAAPAPLCGEAWLGILAYAFQIYFDFSGYSDMAIGLGLMLGFHFPINFDSPYVSRSITEFWRRWHISLSSWLRDYLYISLGGNRKGKVRTYVNLSATMLLGGLWHGASWNFLAWGGYQGFWLVVERMLGKRSLWGRSPRPVQVAATFVLVLFGWVLFRATDLSHAVRYAGSMLGLCGAPGLDLPPTNLAMCGMGCAAVLVWALPPSHRLIGRGSPWFVLLLQALFALAILHLHYQDDVPFLYFQF
ncbi:MAG: MBOAT family protein [Planctomycetota bacterium]